MKKVISLSIIGFLKKKALLDSIFMEKSIFACTERTDLHHDGKGEFLFSKLMDISYNFFNSAVNRMLSRYKKKCPMSFFPKKLRFLNKFISVEIAPSYETVASAESAIEAVVDTIIGKIKGDKEMKFSSEIPFGQVSCCQKDGLPVLRFGGGKNF